jgi:hypothetical protein
MSSKKKPKKGKPQKKENTNKNLIIIVLSLVLVAAVAVIGIQSKSGDQSSDGDNVSMRRGETRATLSPETFSDPFIAGTYQIAKDIPHVLDSLFCYCYCDRDPFHHVSLLSCYVDKHAAG